MPTSPSGHKGIDVRQTANRLVFRAFLQDSSLAILATGTTSLRLYEVQDDGTLKSYDFNDNTFKTTALTTETLAMTHRTGANGGTNTGIWTAVLSTLSGFTNGAIYEAHITNTGASPNVQVREFQFGSEQGDVTLHGNYLQVDAAEWKDGTIPAVNQTGVPLIDLKYILGTALTETAGQLAGAFKKFFNVSTPTAQTDNLPLNTDYTSARAAKLDNLDAAVSTRSTYAGGDTAGTTTLLSRLTAARAGYLDNLNSFLDSATSAIKSVVDAIKAKTDNLPANPASQTNLDVAVSSRLATSGYTAPDNADIAAILARTDVATSTRLAAGSYTAPDNAGIAAIKAKTDNLPADPASVTNQSTINSNVLAVKAKTDNLPASPAAVGSQMNLADGAITTAKVATGVVVGTNPVAGQYTVTLTLEDSSDSTPIPSVFVLVYASDDVTGINQGLTDELGQVTFALNAARYKVHLSHLPDYATAVADLTVSGATGHTFTLDPISVGSPSNPSLCRVYGYEYQEGTPVAARTVSARLNSLPQTTSSVILEGETTTAVSDSSGYWALDLVIGKKYRVTINEAGVETVITVPDAASVDFRTFL